METKYCPTCKNDISVDDFYKNCSRLDGLSTVCKECQKKYVRAYKKTPAGKKMKRKANTRYRGRHRKNNTLHYAKVVLQIKTGMPFSEMDPLLVRAQQLSIQLFRLKTT